MDNPEKFTKEEAALLIELLNKLQISPAHPDAAQTVALVQSAVRKIENLCLADAVAATKSA